MDKKLKVVGALFTTLYLVGLAYWVLAGTANDGHSRWQEFTSMSLNNIGDFMAGAFSPLAFFWLVLGFLQQGQELSLQVEELRHSVDAQRRSADTSERGLQATIEQMQMERQRLRDEDEAKRRAARPNLQATNAGGSHGEKSKHEVVFTNYGAHCTNVRLVPWTPTVQVMPKAHPIIEAGDSVTFYWVLPRNDKPQEFQADLHWVDGLGYAASATFVITYRWEERPGHYTVVITPAHDA